MREKALPINKSVLDGFEVWKLKVDYQEGDCVEIIKQFPYDTLVLVEYKGIEYLFAQKDLTLI